MTSPDTAGPSEPAPEQPRNPLHGVTLAHIVTALAEHYGWAELGARIPLRCFLSEPSVTSSLKMLRRTPWAREKVESLYLFMQREKRRGCRGPDLCAASLGLQAGKDRHRHGIKR